MKDLKFSNEYTYKSFLESDREEEFDELFDSAVAEAKSNFGKDIPLYIGDREVFTDDKLKETSPIDSNILIGEFQRATRKHTIIAIAAANEAFEKWSTTNYKERISVFRKAADIMSKQKFLISAILSYENGKSRYESIGEVDEAIDFMRYYSNELSINKGYNRKTDIKQSKKSAEYGFQGAPTDREHINILMRPYGVFGVIAPFNFPISISVGMSVAAMITGNSVVFKPSSTDNMTMLVGSRLYDIFKDAGVPEGVFNYITGPGYEVGDQLVIDKNVAGIAFTGSRITGLAMMSKSLSVGAQKVFVVEMGGKNAAIVAKSANIEGAASGVTNAAFGFAGQKCSALSRVYVHQSIKEQFISKLIEKTRMLSIGNPIRKEFAIGPLISKIAYNRYVDCVRRAASLGRILYGGKRISTLPNGFYVEPTIAEIRHGSELGYSELFVPILIVDEFKEFGEAIKCANDTQYGLTAGLYTKDKKEIKLFTDAIEAGVVYINRSSSATTGAIVGAHAFVGWKASGVSGKGSGSKFYLQQFLREQSVSITG